VKNKMRPARIVPCALSPLLLRMLGAFAVAGTMTGALAGCQEKKQTPSSNATAMGEVLGGSASDAMLPVDTVRSKPPLAPMVEASGSKPDKTHGRGKPIPNNETVPQLVPEIPADVPTPAPPAQ
jgi:hypothetical protein